jgi:hypothetical protein
MQRTDYAGHLRATAHPHDTPLLVALELSKSTWLIAVSAPGSD